ncbi:hypothetical protein [Haloarchaeobius sp. DT45]|uniref:hypothetical protein n=1 Tax=Haloarchaeobius sp. DT45 TaxID=3446116 RepID=UPI003F6D9547
MDETPATPTETTDADDERDGSFSMHRRELLLSGASYATVGLAGCDTHLVSLAQVRRAARAAESKEVAEAVARTARVKGNPVATAAASNAVSKAVLDQRDEVAEEFAEGEETDPGTAAEMVDEEDASAGGTDDSTAVEESTDDESGTDQTEE